MLRQLVLLSVALAVSGCGKLGGAPGSQDLVVTGAKPDQIVVIDPAARAVKARWHIPDANGIVGTVVPSPDGKIAYALVNRMESISGIELATGRQVFRADLSAPGERVKSIFAFDVSPDGRELLVHELPTKLLPDEYQVQEPRFAVFDTSAGVGARPLRQFPAPRRIHMVLYKKDGKSFYALGFELYEYDARSGKLLAQRGIRSWDVPQHAIPDLLAFWPVSEPTGVFVTPIYSAATPAGGPPVQKTALMTLDLHDGKLAYHDFEDTAALIFSAVMSPVRHEAYGVYAQLTKVDTEHWKLAQRINLDHTYYAVNISSDGREIYAGGAMCDVAFYDSESLKKTGDVRIPDCPDQVLSSLRVVHR